MQEGPTTMSSTATYGVLGMTCGHCVQAVSSEIHGLPGVLNVEVELVEGGTSVVRVVSAEPLTEETVRAAVDEAGYELAAAP
jgi:copper chaperone CopZ